MKQLIERFNKFCVPEPNSGCILWIGAARSHGYGHLNIAGKDRNATHLALLFSGRPVPPGKWALHKCDNPYCVNPDHLFIGDQKMNMADAKKKGRMNLTGLALGRLGNNKKKRAAA